jgi:hypothetical protein
MQRRLRRQSAIAMSGRLFKSKDVEGEGNRKSLTTHCELTRY